MFCTKCGAQIADDAKFCNHCGAPVVQQVAEAAGAGQDTAPYGTAPQQTAPYGTAPQQTAPYGTAPQQDAMPYADAPLPSQQAQPEGASRAQRHTGVLVAACVVLIAALVGGTVLVLDPFHLFDTQAPAVPAATSPAATTEAPGSRPSTAPATTGATTQATPTTKPAPSAPAATSAAVASSSDYILPDSNTRLYSKSELEGLSVDQLWYARNEIYARHGRGFTDEQLQSYFDSKPWYTKQYSPEEFDSMPDPLNSYEKQNADLIKEVEAEKNSSHL